MKKTPFKVQIDPETQQSLHKLGEPHQMTGNIVLAAAAGELAKVQKAGGNLWHALGRIADVETAATALQAPNAPRIARGGHQRALQAV